ncbi:CHAP domain-containing protein [Nonomuraea sp. NN258]|uniref:CHAP domain-containing protein n=1 Tax=Nonomuraea antri TaxID=2730852 RepID=UPI001567D24D|nr:CHAP domain-containing protein [Nonomuraea antri]NRQ34660.1 CHAP domain-containing protein [Nonomuraea antri]
MAKHRLTRALKSDYARVAIGAGVIASVFTPIAATADTVQTLSVAQQSAANGAQTAVQAAKPEEAQVNVTAQQVLELAKAQVGTSENAQGGGTKFQQWYAASPRALETVARDGGNPRAYLNAAWCSMFVSWVGEQTGARTQVGWDAWTVAHAKWFSANDRWGSEAKPGAVVFFNWRGSKSISSVQHVGFVVKDNGDGTISTIEGNTGNGKVEERTRPKSQVVGYGYPKYAA